MIIILNKELFTSNTNEYETPLDFYNELDKEFHFTLDPCATKENAKCKKYYTKKENGLLQDWSKDIVFMNPPYGRVISTWIQKAYNESKKGAFVCCLLPSRTDTKWFHKYCTKGRIQFIKGRLKFNNMKNSAPFPSMLVYFFRGEKS